MTFKERVMTAIRMQRGVLITREAHAALRDLKSLVDLAVEKVHAVELDSVGVAIGHPQREDLSQALLAAAQAVESSKFEAAVREAQAKMRAAVAWHEPKERAASSR
jgi:DNA polymerase III gamma/tau subunit